MNYGEIWQLGRHKLMCGDATKASDIELLVGSEKIDLVLTDPPYGMKAQHRDGAVGESTVSIREGSGIGLDGYALGSRKYEMLIGDSSSGTAKNFYENVEGFSATKIFWGGQYFADFLPVSGAWIFWHKMNGDCDFSDGELAWCSRGKRIRYYAQKWNGCIRSGSQEYNGKTRLHPTQKPVELHMKILEDFSKEGDTILDCFGGSGTTLIACEVTNRNCLMMEISPEYCEIIKSRWEKLNPLFNQNKAERIA